MDTVAAQHGRSLPAEFSGRARLFINKMSDAALVSGTALHGITQDLFVEWERRGKATARKRGHPSATLREDFVREIENRWQAVPALGCISQAAQRDGRYITATDVRIRTEHLRGGHWEVPGTESALCIVRMTLTVNKTVARTESKTLVTMNMKSIGRFFQFAFTPTDASLLTEIAMLAGRATPDLLDTPELRFSFETEHGRAWLGTVAPFSDNHGNSEPALNVRTFR
jgi:hypothetical protein